MKTNMKKLLVIVMALMPSLSICTLAQTPGGGPASSDPEDLPVAQKPSPNPNPTPGPRFAPEDYDDKPICPLPGGLGPGPRIQSVLGGDGNDNDGGPIDLGLGGVRPRNRQDIDPNEIPIKPCPGPGDDHRPRFRSEVQDPECYHLDGVVYIQADNAITYINASVTRYNDNQVWSNTSNTNTLSISASAASGTYLLELTLSDGRAYIGEYTIE